MSVRVLKLNQFCVQTVHDKHNNTAEYSIIVLLWI